MKWGHVEQIALDRRRSKGFNFMVPTPWLEIEFQFFFCHTAARRPHYFGQVGTNLVYNPKLRAGTVT